MRPLLTIPLGLAVGGILAAGCTTTAAEPEAPETTASPSTAAPEIDPHGHDHDHGGELESAPADAAETTAAAFCAAWLDADLAAADFDAWLESMAPYTHGPYLEALATVDPANLPADTLEGDLAPLETDREDTAAFTATGASGAQWTIELYAGDGRWLVYSIAPAAAA
jgi:hypothetical protein